MQLSRRAFVLGAGAAVTTGLALPKTAMAIGHVTYLEPIQNLRKVIENLPQQVKTAQPEMMVDYIDIVNQYDLCEAMPESQKEAHDMVANRIGEMLKAFHAKYATVLQRHGAKLEVAQAPTR